MIKTTLLLDGDVFVYKHTSAVETPIHWGDDLWTLHSDAREAKMKLDIQINGLKKDLEADRVLIAFSSSINFRHTVLPSYKGNRTKRKPVAYSAVRDYCVEAYKTMTLPHLEADDVLGILATGRRIPGRKIVVTVDKDLKSVPCNLFNPMHPADGVVSISKEEADYQHYSQTLGGDSTDGYKGCPGVGPKTAAKLLDASPTWDTVLEAFLTAGLSEEEALIQARVARICRVQDYNMRFKEVKLWTPR